MTVVHLGYGSVSNLGECQSSVYAGGMQGVRPVSQCEVVSHD